MTATTKVPPDKNCTHLAGEYFVAAELYKRGFSVAITLGNAKTIDLFAEKSGRTVNVQVKAIRRQKSVGWPIWRRQVKDHVLYVFVCLNEHDRAPTYFIGTPTEIRPLIKEYATRAILNLGRVNTANFVNAWHKIEKFAGAP